MKNLSKKNSHNFDLLHRRWDIAGESPQRYTSIKKLRRRGAIIGITFSIFCLIVCLLTAIYDINLNKKKERLLLDSLKFDNIDKSYRENLSELKRVVKKNKEISQGIAGIRSGSALLSELRQILPNTIQLELLLADNNNLTLEGLAVQPYGLDSINSLKIQIENSIFIKNDNVKLARAWQAEKPNSSNNRNTSKILKYKIKASFSENYNSRLISYLKKLGSYGLAKRVEKIKQEGLLQ